MTAVMPGQQAQREKNAPVKIAMIKASVVRPITAVTTMAETAATAMTSRRTPHHTRACLRDGSSASGPGMGPLRR